MTSVSRLVRLALTNRLAATFNTALASACAEAAVGQYAINFSRAPEEPQNFYESERSLELLTLNQEPDLPALVVWVGDGQNQNLEMPRTFAGLVATHFRFFLFAAPDRPGDLTELREATEAAMLAALADEFTEITARPDFSWTIGPEQQFLDVDEKHVGWVQEITFTQTFEVSI